MEKSITFSVANIVVTFEPHSKGFSAVKFLFWFSAEVAWNLQTWSTQCFHLLWHSNEEAWILRTCSQSTCETRFIINKTFKTTLMMKKFFSSNTLFYGQRPKLTSRVQKLGKDCDYKKIGLRHSYGIRVHRHEFFIVNLCWMSRKKMDSSWPCTRILLIHFGHFFVDCCDTVLDTST